MDSGEYSATVKKNGKEQKINEADKPGHGEFTQFSSYKENSGYKCMNTQASVYYANAQEDVCKGDPHNAAVDSARNA